MKKFDFSGYATKNDLKCTDGRVIVKDAFKHNDGQTVPLVWQHFHNEPSNILGHAILENREDGVYTYGKFNETEAGKNAKTLVEHGDITALSIYANQLKQQGNSVMHGAIREVSLVVSGANPGAFIDNLSFAHADGTRTEDETEAVIHTGLEFTTEVADVKHEESTEEKTVQDVFDTLSEEQKEVVYAMVAQALGVEKEATHSEKKTEEKKDEKSTELKHNDEGGDIMKKNVFENEKEKKDGTTLTHDQLTAILTAAKKGASLKETFLAHAGTYGIDDIDFLFPDAKTLERTPEWIKRDDSWVAGFISGTTHTPFSRIKSMHADITADEARAKGYIKGNLKTEEVFGLLKRTTTPTTVYKKQKLDRDDIIDITDFDVVAWLKAEMRMMLDEEIARAALVGDGRDPADDDKISATNIRPIWTDADFYSYKERVDNDTTTSELIEAIIRTRKNYKGTGSPNFYTTTEVVTDMLLSKDKMDRRLYSTVAELASVLRVNQIIEVEVMEDLSREVTIDGSAVEVELIGILVNPKDYKMGADKGGQVAMFDDFDIDYNQQKYLIETRLSGALTKYQSAIVIERLPAEE